MQAEFRSYKLLTRICDLFIQPSVCLHLHQPDRQLSARQRINR